MPSDTLQRMRRRSRGSVPWMAVAALALGGALLAIEGTTALLAGVASRSWPTTVGTIELSQMGQGWGRAGLILRFRRTYYFPEIRYRYRVGEREFLSERVEAGRGDFLIGDSRVRETDRAKVEATVARYKVGQTATVYYDPKDPSRAVLEPGPTQKAALKIGLGVALLLTAAGSAFYRRR